MISIGRSQFNLLLLRYSLRNTKHQVSELRYKKPQFNQQHKITNDQETAPTIHKHQDYQRFDPSKAAASEELIAKCTLPVQHLPQRLLKRCQQVFSKYSQRQVRQLSQEYLQFLKIYKPRQKRNPQLKPFQNMIEVSKQRQKVYLIGKQSILKDHIPKLPLHSNQTKNLSSDVYVNIFKQFQSGIIKYTQNMAIAYLYTRMPRTFVSAVRVFIQIKFRLPFQKMDNMLDYGAGLGSGAYAFHDTFQNYKHIVALQPDTIMRKLGKHLTEDIKKLVWISSVKQTISLQFAYRFDLVYAGYLLDDLPDAATRKLILETLWAKIRPGGLLVIIQTGSPRGFRYINDIRNWVFQKNGFIIGPCPHQQQCPLAKQGSIHWCHFQQRIARYPKSIFGVCPDNQIQKFSYLIIRKQEINQEQSLQSLIKIQKRKKIEQRTRKSFSWNRILFPIMIRKGHFCMNLCNTQGTFQRRVISRIQGEAFKKGKRMKWGDLWYYPKYLPNKYRKQSKKGKRLW